MNGIFQVGSSGSGNDNLMVPVSCIKIRIQIVSGIAGRTWERNMDSTVTALQFLYDFPSKNSKATERAIVSIENWESKSRQGFLYRENSAIFKINANLNELWHVKSEWINHIVRRTCLDI
jgi:hypothetical protein